MSDLPTNPPVLPPDPAIAELMGQVAALKAAVEQLVANQNQSDDPPHFDIVGDKNIQVSRSGNTFGLQFKAPGQKGRRYCVVQADWDGSSTSTLSVCDIGPFIDTSAGPKSIASTPYDVMVIGSGDIRKGAILEVQELIEQYSIGPVTPVVFAQRGFGVVQTDWAGELTLSLSFDGGYTSVAVPIYGNDLAHPVTGRPSRFCEGNSRPNIQIGAQIEVVNGKARVRGDDTPVGAIAFGCSPDALNPWWVEITAGVTVSVPNAANWGKNYDGLSIDDMSGAFLKALSGSECNAVLLPNGTTVSDSINLAAGTTDVINGTGDPIQVVNDMTLNSMSAVGLPGATVQMPHFGLSVWKKIA